MVEIALDSGFWEAEEAVRALEAPSILSIASVGAGSVYLTLTLEMYGLSPSVVRALVG